MVLPGRGPMDVCACVLRTTHPQPMLSRRRGALGGTHVWSVLREGLFSWKRSPPSRTMSACRGRPVELLCQARGVGWVGGRGDSRGHAGRGHRARTWYSLARMKISSRAAKESCPRTGSLSCHTHTHTRRRCSGPALRRGPPRGERERGKQPNHAPPARTYHEADVVIRRDQDPQRVVLRRLRAIHDHAEARSDPIRAANVRMDMAMAINEETAR
jgi:hypothetical protein